MACAGGHPILRHQARVPQVGDINTGLGREESNERLPVTVGAGRVQRAAAGGTWAAEPWAAPPWGPSRTPQDELAIGGITASAGVTY